MAAGGNEVMPGAGLDARQPDRPGLAWVAATIAGGAMFWLTWHSVRKGIWVDLDVYVAGGRAVIHSSDLYAVSVHDLPFTYPPFAAVAFVPLALLPDVAARVGLTLLSLAGLATAIEVVRRRLGLSPAQVIPPVLVVLALEPLMRTLLLGQANAVLIALVVLDCLVVPRRHRGWLIGVAAGIKLTPAVFIVWLLLRREWDAAFRAVAAGALTVAVGALIAPSATWFYWTGGFADLGRFGAASVLGTDNQSLSAAVSRLGGLTTVPPHLALLSGLVAVGLGAWVASICFRRGDDVGALLAVALGGLLASPVSWSHHWLWMALLLLWAVAGRRRAWAVVIAAVYWLGPFWAVYREVPTSVPYPTTDRVVSTAYVLVGLASLVLLANSGGHSEPSRPSSVTNATDRSRAFGNRVYGRDGRRGANPPEPDQ